MDVLYCIICTEGFDYDQHAPRVLKCGHTMCTNCIINYTCETSYFVCPLCRTSDKTYSSCDSRSNAERKSIIEHRYPVNKVLTKLLGYSHLSKKVNNKDFSKNNQLESRLNRTQTSFQEVPTISDRSYNVFEALLDHDEPIFMADDLKTIVKNVSSEIVYNRNRMNHYENKLASIQSKKEKSAKWLKENESLIESNNFLSIICKTAADFKDPNRWKNQNPNKILEPKEEKIRNPAPKIEHITDPYNLNIAKDIIKNTKLHANQESEMYWYVKDNNNDYCIGKITQESDQYFIYNGQTRKPSSNSKFFKVQLLKPLFYSVSTTIFMNLFSNNEPWLFLKLKIYKKLDSLKNLKYIFDTENPPMLKAVDIDYSKGIIFSNPKKCEINQSPTCDTNTFYQGLHGYLIINENEELQIIISHSRFYAKEIIGKVSTNLSELMDAYRELKSRLQQPVDIEAGFVVSKTLRTKAVEEMSKGVFESSIKKCTKTKYREKIKNNIDVCDVIAGDVLCDLFA